MEWSSEEAAKQVGISYVTLRRWLARGDIRPSVRAKLAWRWTDKDIAGLRKYKDLVFYKGRGRPGRRREEAVQARNSWKSIKRRWDILDSETKNSIIARAKAERLYEKSLAALHKVGLRPVDPHLMRVEGK
jgi:hypothetical protein